MTLGDAPWRGRVRSSSRVLTAEGLRECDALLDGVSAPRIAIVGSSHSAVSCARVLVERLGSRLGEGSVSLLVRRAPRVFFPSREAAMADGYRDFGERDVCPTTGRVHRLGGLRLEARRFAMGVLGLGSEPAEPRVRLDFLSTMTPDAVRATLRSAHLVVAALGYRPRVVPLFDRAGAPVVLHSDEGARAAVDPWCRVLDARGVAIEDLYAIGLASGFVPWGAMGGEPGFVGQTNGVWLYQHHVGAMIVEQLLGEGRRAR